MGLTCSLCCFSSNKIDITIDKRKFGLGIINPQNDYFQSGSLEIINSNEIIGPINKLRFLLANKINTFISIDAHPHDHISFASTHNKKVYTVVRLDTVMKDKKNIISEQILWPTHCVVNTLGQRIHPHIIVTNSDLIIKKGTIQNVESYSAFGDEFKNYYENTGLNDWLKNKNITDIILVGLAMDFGIYNTALDGIKNGYKVHIILSCVKGMLEQTTNGSIQDLKEHNILFYDDIGDFLFLNSDFL